MVFSYQTLLLFSFLVFSAVTVGATDRRMICKEFENEEEHRMIQVGRPGKAGAPGMKGEKGEPGSVDQEQLKAGIEKEVAKMVEERFKNLHATLNHFNSTLLEMQKQWNQTQRNLENLLEKNFLEKCTLRQGFTYKSKCYWIILQPKMDVQFDDAVNLCRKTGGIPGDILDQSHYDVINQKTRSMIRSGWVRFWTGMNINQSTKIISLSDGTTHDFSPWWRGSPSSNSDQILIYNIVYRRLDAGQGFANSYPAFTTHGVLCQE